MKERMRREENICSMKGMYVVLTMADEMSRNTLHYMNINKKKAKKGKFMDFYPTQLNLIFHSSMLYQN